MKPALHWLAIFIAATAAVVFLTRASCINDREIDPPVEAVRELAAERIEKIEAKAKTVRRAARAHVDQEVRDGAVADDLTGYLGSR